SVRGVGPATASAAGADDRSDAPHGLSHGLSTGVGSRSPDTHRTGPAERGRAAAHAVTAAVFPEPGGPTTTVSGPRTPLRRSLSSRGRATVRSGGGGAAQ